MEDVVRIIQVEDSVTDAELICRELKRNGLLIEVRRVETRAAYLAALEEFAPQVILSDFTMPQFDGLSALELAHEKYPGVPFIFVSGTIDEDTAIAALRGGASDYVLKTNLKRLAPAMQRALKEVRMRIARLQAESRFRDLIEYAPNAIIVFNEHNRIEIVNQSTERLFGFKRAELIGRSHGLLGELAEQRFPELVREFNMMFATAAAQGSRDAPQAGFISSGRRKDGSGFPIEVNLSPLKIDSALWISGVIVDISERNAQELRISRLNRIQMVLSSINAAGVRIRERDRLCQEVCEILVQHGQFELAWIGMREPEGLDGSVTAWAGTDNGYVEHLRVTLDLDRRESGRLPNRAMRENRALIRNDILAGLRESRNRELVLKNGFSSMVALPLVVHDVAVGVLVIYAKDVNFFNQDEMVLLDQLAADISFALEHQKNQERLSYLAYHDSLTGLPNRLLFLDRVEALLKRDRSRQGSQIALVLIDIVRFRNINDMLGRAAGDATLYEVAARLLADGVDAHYLARVDANCFAFIVTSGRGVGDLVASSEPTIMRCLDKSMNLAGKEIRISGRAGVAIFPDHAEDAVGLLRNAEAALQNAKLAKVPHLVYCIDMSARMADKLSMESRLKRALERQEFVLHYQPKIELATGELIGLEALIRWNDPENGLIPPMQFIPILEETGLIVEVGAWVIREAFRQFQEWSIRGLAPPRIAVNVSELQIRQKNFVGNMLSVLNGDMVDALEIEITESLFMDDLGENIEKLGLLRAAGFTITVDDFGTGFSSLSYIARLPIDTLKIDRSFIAEMRSSANHMAIVSTIIALAHGLNLKVVAEGVETEEQVRILRALHCEQIQGFLYGRPLPAEQIEARLGKRGDQRRLNGPMRA